MTVIRRVGLKMDLLKKLVTVGRGIVECLVLSLVHQVVVRKILQQKEQNLTRVE
jgi:hypothetical protein